jgi:hypothetical protein
MLTQGGRNICGAAIGVLRLDSRFPKRLGHLKDFSGLSRPVLYEVVEGPTVGDLVNRPSRRFGGAAGRLDPRGLASAPRIAETDPLRRQRAGREPRGRTRLFASSLQRPRPDAVRPAFGNRASYRHRSEGKRTRRRSAQGSRLGQCRRCYAIAGIHDVELEWRPWVATRPAAPAAGGGRNRSFTATFVSARFHIWLQCP